MDITEFYKKYRKALFSYAYRLTRHRETAEDLTHDAFLEVIKHQKSVNLAWLKSVVYHLYTKQRETEYLSENIATENLAKLIEREDEARRRLEKLTPEERETIEMIADGKTQKEIAKQMQTYQQDISRRIKKIRRKLKKFE